MKIIDLLNKIANGEEVPKRIKYLNSIWEYNENTKDYIYDNIWLIYSMNSIGLTEREIEIIDDEEWKTIKEYPNYDLLIKENNKLSYKWNELIKRLFSKFNETQETFYLDIVQIMEEIDKSCKEIK